MSRFKQIIVVRNDLNMRKGKMIAQGARASIMFLRQPFLDGVVLCGSSPSITKTMDVSLKSCRFSKRQIMNDRDFCSQAVFSLRKSNADQKTSDRAGLSQLHGAIPRFYSSLHFTVAGMEVGYRKQAAPGPGVSPVS